MIQANRVLLRKVTISKYKSFERSQAFQVEDGTTVLVGMNESGKTAALEALAKSNYFQEDKEFNFNVSQDYPRREKKEIDKSGEDPIATTLEYEVGAALMASIDADLGGGVVSGSKFSVSKRYGGRKTWDIKCDAKGMLTHLLDKSKLPDGIFDRLLKIQDSEGFSELVSAVEGEEDKLSLQALGKFYENEWGWERPLQEYVARVVLQPLLPKSLYYDEYYGLPSRVSLVDIRNDSSGDAGLKTAKALLELAGINLDQITAADTFEDFIAELEAVEAAISDELFKYWGTNKNLSIKFAIDKQTKETPQGPRIVDHVLDIRVYNQRARVSLPLRNRSKGFNWFFSFLVWFKRIQEDRNSTYILLLDEPGLNLHAAAQGDLLRFIDDLACDYQTIYTTHSPFMVAPDSLHTIRTVLETKEGSKISDSITEKDPNTLFPLQAALGYNIAQNLFISKYNLVVEGVSDMIYLQVMSAILEAEGRGRLDPKITIVPVGGLDKVVSFVSLLRANDLNIGCLLDTIRDARGKARLDDLVRGKIISEAKIRTFEEFVADYPQADIEDLFAKTDYLKIYNAAFPDRVVDIKVLDSRIKPILLQLAAATGQEKFNHYGPANALARQGLTASDLEEETLLQFERAIGVVNAMFK